MYAKVIAGSFSVFLAVHAILTLDGKPGEVLA
jgi:hypothetical protein